MVCFNDNSFDWPAPLPRPTSPRTLDVVRRFALECDAAPRRRAPSPCRIVLPGPGQLLLIGGPSGSGKSTLLRACLRAARREDRSVFDLARIVLPRRATLDCFDGIPIDDALRLLCRVGLAEAWTWLRSPRELSDGQRWRLRLAIALQRCASSSTEPLLVCDEFGALLDRVTAIVVARALRHAIDSGAAKFSAVLATSHDDLRSALQPDFYAECDFGSIELRAGREGTR